MLISNETAKKPTLGSNLLIKQVFTRSHTICGPGMIRSSGKWLKAPRATPRNHVDTDQADFNSISPRI